MLSLKNMLMISILVIIISTSLIIANNPYDPTREKYRPVIGGVQIELVKFWWFIPIESAYCTIGYIAQDDNGNLGIVTAGHCSDWSTDYSVYQPEYGTWGSNYLNNPSSTDRMSDSEFIPFNNAQGSILFIAYNAGNYQGVIVDVDTVISWTTISNGDPHLYYKTGRTTGRTSGYIVSTYTWYNASGTWLYKVILTTIYVEAGDSGSPLYRYEAGRDGSDWLGLAGHLSFALYNGNNFLYSGFIHVNSVHTFLGVSPATR